MISKGSLGKMYSVILLESDDVLNYVNKRVLQLIGFSGSIHLFSSASAVQDFLSQYFRELGSPNATPKCTLVFVDDELPEDEVLELLEFLATSPQHIREKLLVVLMVAGPVMDRNCEFGDLDLQVEIVSKPLTKSLFQNIVKNGFCDGKLSTGK